MTYREKFKKDHPEMSDDECDFYMACNCPEDVEHSCPEKFRDIRPLFEACEGCWNREVPEKEDIPNDIP